MILLSQAQGNPVKSKERTSRGRVKSCFPSSNIIRGAFRIQKCPFPVSYAAQRGAIGEERRVRFPFPVPAQSTNNNDLGTRPLVRYVLSAVSIPRFQRLNKWNRMHCPIGPQKGTRTTTSISIMGMKRLGVRYPDMSTRKSHSVPFPIVVWPMIHRWKKRISWSLSPSLICQEMKSFARCWFFSFSLLIILLRSALALLTLLYSN